MQKALERGTGAPSPAKSLLYVFIGVGITVAVIAALYALRSCQRRQAAHKGLYTFGAEVELDGPDPDAVGVYS